MTKISNLEMAAAVSAHPHIEVQKTFFGLRSKLIYTPTGSTVHARIYDFNQELGKRIEKLLNSRGEQLEREITAIGRVNSVTIGNMRLDVCLSDDRQFAALQLFRFADLMYHPLGEPRFFEGGEAHRISTLF